MVIYFCVQQLDQCKIAAMFGHAMFLTLPASEGSFRRLENISFSQMQMSQPFGLVLLEISVVCYVVLLCYDDILFSKT